MKKASKFITAIFSHQIEHTELLIVQTRGQIVSLKQQLDFAESALAEHETNLKELHQFMSADESVNIGKGGKK